MNAGASSGITLKELVELLGSCHLMGLYVEVLKHRVAEQIPEIHSRIYNYSGNLKHCRL